MILTVQDVSAVFSLIVFLLSLVTVVGHVMTQEQAFDCMVEGQTLVVVVALPARSLGWRISSRFLGATVMTTNFLSSNQSKVKKPSGWNAYST
jgi:hypothetical protein